MMNDDAPITNDSIGWVGQNNVGTTYYLINSIPAHLRHRFDVFPMSRKIAHWIVQQFCFDLVFWVFSDVADGAKCS